MKKLLQLTVLFCFFQVMVFSQDLEVLPNTVNTISITAPFEWDYPVHSTIHNSSGGPLNLRWKKIIISKTTDWVIQVCDKNLCYSASVDSAEFDLVAGDTGRMEIHFFPHDVSGAASVQIIVYEIGNPSNSVSAQYNCSSPTGINDKGLSQNFYFGPNPAKNILTVQLPSNYRETIEIFNVLGLKVKAQKGDGGNSLKFDLSNIPSGIYLLRYKNENGVSITQNFVKE